MKAGIGLVVFVLAVAMVSDMSSRHPPVDSVVSVDAAGRAQPTVRPSDKNSPGAGSGTGGNVAPADTNPPGVPAGVLAFDLPEDDGTHVRVTWKASSDPEGGPVVYRVSLRPADSTEEYAPASEESVSDTSFDVAGLSKQRRYEFVVAAVDRFGNSSANSQPAAASPSDEVPQAPASAPTALGGVDGITVSWVEAPEADTAGYKLERAEVQVGASGCDPTLTLFEPTYVEVAQIRGRTNTTYLDESAESTRRYCYRYRIFDNSHPPNDSGYSPAALATASPSG
ncbi:MAG: fibronectin type III domain-containing protein [Nitriliruptorales bacterium]